MFTTMISGREQASERGGEYLTFCQRGRRTYFLSCLAKYTERIVAEIGRPLTGPRSTRALSGQSTNEIADKFPPRPPIARRLSVYRASGRVPSANAANFRFVAGFRDVPPLRYPRSGIDAFSCARSGGMFDANGGHFPLDICPLTPGSS